MADTRQDSIVGGKQTTTFSHVAADDNVFLLDTVNEANNANMQMGNGTITVATAGTEVTLAVTFPQAYMNMPMMVFVSYSGGLSGDAGYINVYADQTLWSKTGFTVKANAYVSGTMKFTWHAMGM